MRGRISDRARVRTIPDGDGNICLMQLTSAGAKRFRRNAQRLGLWRKGQHLSTTMHAVISFEITHGASGITAPPAKRRTVKGKRYSVAASTPSTVKGGQEAA